MASAAAQRRALVRLTDKSSGSVSALVRSFDVNDAQAVKAGLIRELPAIGRAYSGASATLGADFYDLSRRQAGARGRFVAKPAIAVDASRYESLAGWGIDPLFGEVPNVEAAVSLLSGGMQRIVANAFRETVTAATAQDKAARGWAREGGGGCDFCSMLISRGAVYSEATADFESHDRCHCVAVPVFD